MPEPSTLVAALLLAVVPSVLYLVVLNAIDRYEKEPWTILLACLGLGAVAAPILAVVVLVILGRPAALPPAFAPGLRPDPVVGIVAEIAKGVLLLALVHSVRDEFDDILDGVIYGAAVGAGFGAAESFLYALGGTGQLDGGTIALLVIAGLNHAFYTAVFGATLGFAQRLDRGERTIVIGLGLATAALLHAFHDTLPAILARLLGQPDAALGLASRLLAEAINWLGILTLALIVVLAWRREARILRNELRDEVASGLVSEADYATITSFGGRLGRQARLLRTGGVGSAIRLRRLYAAEGELAFHKWRLGVRHRRPPATERGDELRAEIRRLGEMDLGGAR
ncbi:MAG TPA: PrsW family glutamic-type intramembrane protease [Candidatus Nanopelagicales bacterium]|nr:PrsW family glutamic-type intramembrane protease [Candidatus Nanopelagicales bacterium]